MVVEERADRRAVEVEEVRAVGRGSVAVETGRAVGRLVVKGKGLGWVLRVAAAALVMATVGSVVAWVAVAPCRVGDMVVASCRAVAMEGVLYRAEVAMAGDLYRAGVVTAGVSAAEVEMVGWDLGCLIHGLAGCAGGTIWVH